MITPFVLYKKFVKMVFNGLPGWRIRVSLLRSAGYIIGQESYIGEELLIIDEPQDCGMITIGDRVAIAPRVTLIASSYANFSRIRSIAGEKHAPVVIEDDAWIGTGAIVLPGLTIGTGAVVSAGAVVTKNVCSYSVVAGVPARVIAELRKPTDVCVSDTV